VLADGEHGHTRQQRRQFRLRCRLPGRCRRPGEDLHAEWERSGEACLKILAVEQPAALAALVAKVLPQAFDDEHPAVLHIVTGVVRHGEVEHYPDRAPQIPPAAAPAIAPRDDEFQED